MSDCNDELASCASLCTMEERQTALLSVSVTFKPPENLDTDDNSDRKIPKESQGKNESDDTVGDEEPLCKNEGNAESTSPTNISCNETKVQAETGIKSKVTKTEIMPGWKGYSNNIYIQPIIVNSQRNQENKNSLKSGTLTVEDLRQQLRLRQSSEWVVKHNQRMNLKGTLKTGAPNLKPEIDTSISRCHSSRTTTGNHPEVDFSQHSQRARQTSRLAKGFVCRHWERDYLSKENISHKAGEPSSLTIRSYVNVNVMDTLTKTVRAQEHKKRERPDITSRQDENTNESSPDCVDEKGHQPSRRSSLSSLSSNELIPKEDLHQDINDLIFGNISVNVRNSCTDESCTCRLSAPGSQGRILTCPGKSGKEKNKPRNLLKRRQEEKIFMPVPLKEFPPIDPLRDIKMSSSKFQTMGKRKLPRRPHTVGAPCSLSYINDKKKTESPRISSSKSLDNHFRGIHGKAVKHPSKNWQTRGRSSK